MQMQNMNTTPEAELLRLSLEDRTNIEIMINGQMPLEHIDIGGVSMAGLELFQYQMEEKNRITPERRKEIRTHTIKTGLQVPDIAKMMGLPEDVVAKEVEKLKNSNK